MPGGSGLPVADSTEVRAGGDHGLNGLGARETIGPGVSPLALQLLAQDEDELRLGETLRPPTLKCHLSRRDVPWFWEHRPPPWEGGYDLSGPALGKAGEPESRQGGPTAGRPAGWLWVRSEPGSPARVPWLLWG